jgi:hypothetical protein
MPDKSPTQAERLAAVERLALDMEAAKAVTNAAGPPRIRIHNV